MDILGLVQTGLGLGATTLSGASVVSRRKGTRRHRLLVRTYFPCMVGLNATALMIYDLFGGFGTFHWFALLSLATVAAGFVPACRKQPRGTRVSHHA